MRSVEQLRRIGAQRGGVPVLRLVRVHRLERIGGLGRGHGDLGHAPPHVLGGGVADAYVAPGHVAAHRGGDVVSQVTKLGPGGLVIADLDDALARTVVGAGGMTGNRDLADRLAGAQIDDHGRAGRDLVAVRVLEVGDRGRVAVDHLLLGAAVGGVEVLQLHASRRVRSESLLLDLVDVDALDAEPQVIAVVGGGDQSHAGDAGDVQTGDFDRLLGALRALERRIRHVGPVLAVRGGLQLGVVEVVLAAVEREADALERGGLAELHADVVALVQVVRVLEHRDRAVLAIEDVFDRAGGRRGEHVADVRLGHDVRVGLLLHLVGQVGVHRLDERHNVLHADLGVLGVVHVVEAVLLGRGERGLRVGVLLERRGRVAVQRGLDTRDVGERGLGGVIPAVDPRGDLLVGVLPGVVLADVAEHLRIALGAVGLGCLLQRDERGLDVGQVVGGDGAVSQLRLGGGQCGSQVHGLLQRGDARIHVLVDGVLGQLTQRVRRGSRHSGVVVDERERILPCLVGLALAPPDVPRVGGVAEDADLARLGLLHRVEHDALDLRRVDARMQERVVAAHDQVALRVVGARPVDPHVGAAADVRGERVGEVLRDLAPDASAGHDDLHFLGEVGEVAHAVAHVFLRDERQRGLEIRVGLLHFLEPRDHIGEQLGVIVTTHVRRVIGQDGDLAYADPDGLRELVLQHLQIGLIVRLGVEPNRVVHERVQSEHETRLGGVAGIGERLDLGVELVLRVQRTPLRVVLRIVLGGVEVRVELVVAAPLHQVDAVLSAPRVAVVAFDETAADHVGVVGDGEVADRQAIDLAEHLVQGGQAVEAGVGVFAEHGDRAVVGLEEV